MTDILVADFTKGFFIFLRVTGVFFTAPVFNIQSIPAIAKLFLSIVVAYIIFFTIPGTGIAVPENLLSLGIMGIKEMITGILMGFTLNFVFYGISFAGLLLGYEMGLMMAQMFDPTTESNENMIGQTLLMIGLLVFVVIDGHHIIITSLSYSFKMIPVGFYTINESVYALLLKYSAGIFILAVKIAAPVMVSFFLLHLGAGVIARAIPQMNIFFVIYPLKIGLGFLLVFFMLPIYVYVIKNLLHGLDQQLLQLLKAMSY